MERKNDVEDRSIGTLVVVAYVICCWQSHMINTKHGLSVDVARELATAHAAVHVYDSQHVPLVRLEDKLHSVALDLLAFAQSLQHQRAASQVGGVTQLWTTSAEPISMKNTHTCIQVHLKD